MYRNMVSNVNGCASETFHNILNIHCSYLIQQQTSTRNLLINTDFLLLKIVNVLKVLIVNVFPTHNDKHTLLIMTTN